MIKKRERLDLLKCDKCDFYLWPECDEDGCWSSGCRHEDVVSVFDNFIRIYKCKYFKPISQERAFKRLKTMRRRITGVSFYYRDPDKTGRVNRKPRFIIGFIRRLQEYIHRYLVFRDFYFNQFPIHRCFRCTHQFQNGETIFRDLNGWPKCESCFEDYIYDEWDWEGDNYKRFVEAVKKDFNGNYKKWHANFYATHSICQGDHDGSFYYPTDHMEEINGKLYCSGCVDDMMDDWMEKRKEAKTEVETIND